jgi:import inner membrane translocase subunit TIM23
MNRKVVAQIDALDREFYKHVAKNRVAAELQSATNPVPDYYGEPTLRMTLVF